MLEVTNPFSEGGEFRIVLIESTVASSDTARSTSLMKSKDRARVSESFFSTSFE